MTPTTHCQRIRQSALGKGSGTPIGEVRLSDRARLGIAIQAAALLSHLEAVRWNLISEWRGLWVNGKGLIVGAICEPGVAPRSAPEQLIDLFEVLFGSRARVIGKGPSKRIADQLLQGWKRARGSLPANKVVTELLRATGFFWQPSCSAVRQCLIAEFADSEGVHLRVAGPGHFEQRLLALGLDYAGLLDLATRVELCEVWALGEDGRPIAESDDGQLELARRLYGQGRWRTALQAVEGIESVAGRVLTVHCQRQLGKLRSAKSSLVHLARRPGITISETHSIVEAGVALCLETANYDEALTWLAQNRFGQEEEAQSKLQLLRAEIALASGDLHQVRQHLGNCRRLALEGSLSWRWNRLAAFGAFFERDPAAAKDFLEVALSRGRSFVPRVDACRLWIMLARIRIDRGNLAGGEKAARHALRLAAGVDEAAAIMASRLVSEHRLRQGIALDVETLSPTISPRTSVPEIDFGPEAAELLARRELVLGQPLRAWRILEPVLNRSAPERFFQKGRLCGLAVRALGWLGRGSEARELLNQFDPVDSLGLEAEEYPAAWALAGDWLRAREATSSDAIGAIWRRGLQGEPMMEDDWQILVSLGRYRGARMVFDFQMLLPHTVPRAWLDWAATGLRRVGADPFAERLDRRRKGSWRALRKYLEQASGGVDELGSLFESAGYFDVRLEWQDKSARLLLVSGRGGSLELKARAKWGQLVLSAEQMDPTLEALFALAAREFMPNVDPGGEPSTWVTGILGQSTALRHSLSRLERLAATDVAVLIQGETGTGKELAARQLHQWSRRSAERLVAVNCGALSEALLLSDLFGHVRGAFTGADRDRAGIFETAAGGTVLLDEIGDLPLTAQGKLLRVFQEREVRRVGESLPRQVDVRIVAATHRNLESMVETNTFRSDLYYRLKVGSVKLPPLRNREGDVVLLSQHFLKGTGYTLTRQAQESLLHHDWPGNVRELHNVLEVALALSPGTVIDSKALDLPQGGSKTRLGYHRQVEDLRRRLVQEALTASNGNRGQAARRLDLSRQALSYLVRRFGIDGV